VRPANVHPGEGRPQDVRPGEVRTNGRLLRPPSVPNLDASSEEFEMLWVSASRLNVVRSSKRFTKGGALPL
jgi:hypothetical protein